MIITRLGHAALLVETAEARVLVDPGVFSTEWHGIADLDAVLVTHQHADHVDPDHIAALGGSPRLLAEAAAASMLDGAEAVRGGDSFRFGDLAVDVVGGEHALIHESVPRVGNVGFVLAASDGPRLFHPGDAYAAVPEAVDVLALPITAPWARVGDTIDFARAVAAPRMIPIHDAIAGELGRPIYMRMCSGQVEGVLDDPAVGEPYPV